MHTITLVATVHKERGLCNSNELLKIIEVTTPEVVFEEQSPGNFSAIYNGSESDTLETKAIKKHLQKHPIKHIPVDKDNTEYLNNGFKNDMDELFNIFAIVEDYNKIWYQRNVLTYKYGFPFLNSEYCAVLFEYLNQMEVMILKIQNNERLSHLHKVWLDIHHKRENEMINNIYEFSLKNKYDRALFLVGAEHRKPLIEKIQKFREKESIELNWDFEYFKDKET